jgi:hypothetical protein
VLNEERTRRAAMEHMGIDDTTKRGIVSIEDDEAEFVVIFG